VLSPVSIKTQSLALRALRLDGNRDKHKCFRWQAANHGCHSIEHPIGCCLQPIGCSVEAVATMIGCLPIQALAFSPVSIQTQRKRLRLDGNRALEMKLAE